MLPPDFLHLVQHRVCWHKNKHTTLDLPKKSDQCVRDADIKLRVLSGLVAEVDLSLVHIMCQHRHRHLLALVDHMVIF